MNDSRNTPRQRGFRMPAEFGPHRGSWMLWPERPDVWREGAGPAQRVFTEVAAAIAGFEPLSVGVSEANFHQARKMLPAAARLEICDFDDAWVRDTGPTILRHPEGELLGVDWEFNAWGGLYANWEADGRLAGQVLHKEGIERCPAPLVMEGGSFHTDGEGTLLVTAQCLLHPNRNPQLTQGQIERRLQDYLGVEQVIWLPEGVFNDETDGHVDNLCCFVRPGVVALTWTDDPYDPQFDISRAAYEVLRRARDARGRQFEIHKIHQPDPMFYSKEESDGLVPVDGSFERPEGERLAASYINFYIVNGGIIAPVFDDPHDQAALNTLRAIFPDRRVVGIYAREILLGGGNIHCITQQVPSRAGS